MELTTVLEANCQSLRMLALSGRVAWFTNLLRVAESLTHLAITNAEDCTGLDIVLVHAQSLVSLSVIGCRTLDFLQMSARREAMPHLRDLKIGYTIPLGHPRFKPGLMADACALQSFAKSCAGLRRFDYSLEAKDRPEPFIAETAYTDKWFPIIVDASCEFANLESLGITFPHLSVVAKEKALQILTSTFAEHPLTSLRSLRLGGVSLHDIQTLVRFYIQSGLIMVDLWNRSMRCSLLRFL